MKGDAKIIDLLNKALQSELTAVNQYFLHGEMCGHWGYPKLYAILRKNSIDEMKHAEGLIERILFLGGLPGMNPNAITVGQNVKEQFENDLALERVAVSEYNASVKASFEAGDNVSKELFQTMLKDEEAHVSQLETQLRLLAEMGLETYLSLQTES